MAGQEVRIGREALPVFADLIADRLRAFEAGRSFSPARYGNDWGLKFAAANAFVRVTFSPFTPAGSVYLDELRTAGFFDPVIGYT